MKKKLHTTSAVLKAGTYKEFHYDDLKPNPLNPRLIFDEEPLKILEENIRKNGILVPLTVYLEKKNGEYYILDGQRRWTCAKRIEVEGKERKKVSIPANIVDPPNKIANILYMFNIHNLREQWDLMPTALSLGVLMKELKETDEKKLAQLTELSEPQVARCKVLLSFDEKYHQMMLHPNPEKRIPANFFIELFPVLGLFEKIPAKYTGGRNREVMTDHFLDLYTKAKIRSVIHFRRILEAHDYLKETEKYAEFLGCVKSILESSEFGIRELFDPLVAQDKKIATAEKLCADFLKKMKVLKLSKVMQKEKLEKELREIKKFIDNLLSKLAS